MRPQRFTELPSRYLALYYKYAAPDSAQFYSSSHVPGVPPVVSVKRYTYADARPFERAYSPDGARIIDRPQESRLLVVATSAQPPSAVATSSQSPSAVLTSV